MTVKEILSKYGLSLTKSSRYYGDLMKEITWTYIYIYIYIEEFVQMYTILLRKPEDIDGKITLLKYF
jgi:hypothetical protein